MRLAAAGRSPVGTLIRPMTPLGQFRNTFIIAVDEGCDFDQRRGRTDRRADAARLTSSSTLESEAGHARRAGGLDGRPDVLRARAGPRAARPIRGLGGTALG